MSSTKFILSILFSAVSFQAGTSSPVAGQAQYPEVIPGPGLPSLASLGLTSKDLYEMPLPKEASDLMSVNFDPGCGPVDSAYAPVADIIACYNFLRNLGTQNCQVKGGSISEFCYSGQGHALGRSLTGRDESSYCSDVAQGLLYVINHCTRSDQMVGGYAPPNGNGNIAVMGTNIRYSGF